MKNDSKVRIEARLDWCITTHFLAVDGRLAQPKICNSPETACEEDVELGKGQKLAFKE